jgi:Sporulation and spore germination/Immunoglobulin-like domain of bacterial spore germination
MKRLSLVSAVVLVLAGASSIVAAPTRSSAPRAKLAVYLVRAGHVAPVRRVATGTAAPARASLTALLAGPSASERRQGYTTAIPVRTRLRAVSLTHGVLTVDLSGRFQSGGGSQSMLLRVAQVVYTATAFPSVERVAFRLDGRPVAAIGGEGVIVSPPVGRPSFEAQAPPILVEQPLPGERVSTPLRIRGTANVFEARFSIDVVKAAGGRLAHRAVSASAGTGTRGSFDVTVPLGTASGPVVVIAYVNSPKDGSRIDVVRVPVTLRRP